VDGTKPNLIDIRDGGKRDGTAEARHAYSFEGVLIRSGALEIMVRRLRTRIRVCSPFGRVEVSVGQGNGRGRRARHAVVGRLRGIDSRRRDRGGRSALDKTSRDGNCVLEIWLRCL
jgi:hypothetical protein